MVIARHVSTGAVSEAQTRRIILLLSGSVVLMMTGYGLVMPVLGRRLGELGAGVDALGIITMAFALAQMIGAPLMGQLADTRGRRPIILLSLTAVTLAYVGYLLADTVVHFVLVRAGAGFLSAGLFPAVMGVVADLVPGERRARWAGVVMGSYAVGMVFGPVIGGVLYDALGYTAPFLLSAVVAGTALIATLAVIPETRTSEIRNRERLQALRARPHGKTSLSLWEILPRPLTVFGALLLVDFINAFGFAFVEPQMIFYFYDTLGWSTTQFGVLVGLYGMSAVAGQFGLGQLSDRWGRKPLIIAGLIPNIAFFGGLALITDYYTMMIGAVFAGLGNALLAPAANAFYLDITAEEHRSRIIGVKGSVLSLGGVLGPLAVAVASDYLPPQEVFWVACALTAGALIIAVVGLKTPRQRERGAPGMDAQAAERRALAAQASLQTIVRLATAARQGKAM
ncbi:MAG: hypothetical protein Kow0047_34320 [Anaerolineae bacterium]